MSSPIKYVYTSAGKCVLILYQVTCSSKRKSKDWTFAFLVELDYQYQLSQSFFTDLAIHLEKFQEFNGIFCESVDINEYQYLLFLII